MSKRKRRRDSTTTLPVVEEVTIADEENARDDYEARVQAVVSLATKTTKGRIEESTRKSYEASLVFIAQRLSVLMPSAVDASGALVIPMTLEAATVFMGLMSEPQQKKQIRALKTMDAYVSAIKHIYREKEVDLSPELCRFFKSFSDGYKRKVAKAKDEGTMKSHEGKAPINYILYMQLCALGLFAPSMRSTSSSFVHLFMVLCWNLFARSINVADLRMTHLSWSNDALIVTLNRHKADQTGEHISPKHLYANPYKPAICPILALGIHMLSYSFRPVGDDATKIFLRDPYNSFVKWLEFALGKVSELAYEVKEFGSHSFRKGVATYCSGFLGGPSVVAIFIRAGWSLGQVQDRYIGFTEGADQLCGRVAAGLDFNESRKFAVLPPCFRNQEHILTEDEWESIAPGYKSFPNGFKTVMPFLLASVVYHWEWLTERNEAGQLKNMSHNHPFFSSDLFKSGLVASKLKAELLPLNDNGSCEQTLMRASGIPPHVETNRRIDGLQDNFREIKGMFSTIEQKFMHELPCVISDHIRNNFQVQGVNQLTVTELHTVISDVVQRSITACMNSNPGLQGVVTTSDAQNSTTHPGGSFGTTIEGYGFWSWGGKLNRPVPSNFLMPNGNAMQACSLFLFGIETTKIRPFRLFDSNDIPRKEQDLFFVRQNVSSNLSSKKLWSFLISLFVFRTAML